MAIVVLCNPENRRAKMFGDAAGKIGVLRPDFISYNDVLDGKVTLSQVLTSTTLLRIESPGENFDTERKLIARGASVSDNSKCERILYEDAMQLQPDHGRVRLLRQWFLGFSDLLSEIEKDIKASSCVVMNSPAAIRLMFDKVKCQQHLKDSGIPVPRLILEPASYDELKDFLKRSSYKRVFIKPAHASSASGVLAYRIQGAQEELYSSAKLVKSNGEISVYNTLKLSRYTSVSDIRTLIDFILREGAVIEEWIPKACLQEKFFDVRIVVINGKASAVLPRLSRGPITNLHLLNERGESEKMKAVIGEEVFSRMLACAEEAVDSIDGALYAGVDMLLTAGSLKPRVLELNAFGDLLPGLITNTGDDVYTRIIKEVLLEA
jgi:glutathione synthase/RimK-type ligase-like ATP-grasp enzyme